MCATSLGKLCASDHAMNAIDEMSALNRDLRKFSMSMAQPTRYGRNWKRKPGGICNEVHRNCPFGMWALFAGSFQSS